MDVIGRKPRVAITPDVQVRVKGRDVGVFKVRNLSTSGALISGIPPVNGPEPLEVRFEIMGRNVPVSARVTRIEANRDPAFAIHFDHSTESQAMVAALVEAAIVGTSSRRTSAVVLVTDPDVRDPALEASLAERGYKVHVADSSRDTFRWLQDPELRVEAIMMSTAHGLASKVAFLELLATEFPAVRRILYSADAMEVEGLELALDGHAQKVLVHPCPPAELDRALRG